MFREKRKLAGRVSYAPLSIKHVGSLRYMGRRFARLGVAVFRKQMVARLVSVAKTEPACLILKGQKSKRVGSIDAYPRGCEMKVAII
jgi:hypothetical protein